MQTHPAWVVESLWCSFTEIELVSQLFLPVSLLLVLLLLLPSLLLPLFFLLFLTGLCGNATMGVYKEYIQLTLELLHKFLSFWSRLLLSPHPSYPCPSSSASPCPSSFASCLIASSDSLCSRLLSIAKWISSWSMADICTCRKEQCFSDEIHTSDLNPIRNYNAVHCQSPLQDGKRKSWEGVISVYCSMSGWIVMLTQLHQNICT